MGSRNVLHNANNTYMKVNNTMLMKKHLVLVNRSIFNAQKTSGVE